MVKKYGTKWTKTLKNMGDILPNIDKNPKYNNSSQNGSYR